MNYYYILVYTGEIQYTYRVVLGGYCTQTWEGETAEELTGIHAADGAGRVECGQA